MTQTLDKPRIDFDTLLNKRCECTLETNEHPIEACPEVGKYVVTGGLTGKVFVVCEGCKPPMKVRG